MIVLNLLNQISSDLKENEDRYKLKCPYCQDVLKNGVVYKNSLHFHCFKCNTHKTILELIKDNLNVSDNNYNLVFEKFNKINLTKLTQNLIDYINDFSIDKKIIFGNFNIVNIDEDIRAKRFLISNGLYDKKNCFAYNKKDKLIYLFNQNNLTEKVIGFYILNLQNFGKIESYSNLIELHKRVFLNDLNDINLNNLSNIFNILNINLTNIISVFDDVLNSLFIDNSIYMINNKYLLDDYNLRFIYANNSYGIGRYKEKVLQNQKCFNWNLFLKSNNLKNKIYDINDLKKYELKNNISFNIDNYFTNG